MTKDSNLLPCPFCGADAQLTRFERGDGVPPISITQIQCVNDDKCQVCVDIQHVNEAVAIEAWNTRALPQGASNGAIAEELREYTAMKYAGDCKCGKCQLVPRELVERIYHTLNAAPPIKLVYSKPSRGIVAEMGGKQYRLVSMDSLTGEDSA